jgi:hypothetical protein
MPYLDECPTCGEIQPRGNHKCPPAWLVRNEQDDESDAYTIYEHTASGAAEAFCRLMDEGESTPHDRQVIVSRKPPCQGHRLGPSHFDMRAEQVAHYLPF